MTTRHWLFPEPPRDYPGRRWLGIVLRTAHLMAFGVLVGGHVFDVEATRLLPFLYATIASGVALMAVEMASTCEWLLMGKGLAVVLKLTVLLAVPLLWEHRGAILLATVAVAGVGAHMPSRFRHYSILSGRVVEGPPRRSRVPGPGA